MDIVHFSVGDVLKMKKPHPCASDTFKVIRSGSDVRILCTKCNRDITLPREKLEKMIKNVVSQSQNKD